MSGAAKDHRTGTKIVLAGFAGVVLVASTVVGAYAARPDTTPSQSANPELSVVGDTVELQDSLRPTVRHRTAGIGMVSVDLPAKTVQLEVRNASGPTRSVTVTEGQSFPVNGATVQLTELGYKYGGAVHAVLALVAEVPTLELEPPPPTTSPTMLRVTLRLGVTDEVRLDGRAYTLYPAATGRRAIVLGAVLPDGRSEMHYLVSGDVIQIAGHPTRVTADGDSISLEVHR